MFYTSQVLELVKNAANDIFSLVSSNLMSIFSQNIGHQEQNISKSKTTIVQLNIFNESHPVATFSSKTGGSKSLLNARGFLHSSSTSGLPFLMHGLITISDATSYDEYMDVVVIHFLSYATRNHIYHVTSLLFNG